MGDAEIVRLLPADVRRDGWVLTPLGKLNAEDVYTYHRDDDADVTPFVVYVSEGRARIEPITAALPAVGPLLEEATG